MNKAEFNKFVRDVLAKRLMNSNIDEANTAIDVFTDSVIEALKNNDEIFLVGFGRFSKQRVKARTGRNPKTGEPIDVPAYVKINFIAGKNLKDAVNGLLATNPPNFRQSV